MQNALEKIPEIVQLISLLLSALTIVATIIVRLTPSKTDDQVVGSFTSMLMKALHFLPTIGVNPQTKKLEETLLELKEKDKPK